MNTWYKMNKFRCEVSKLWWWWATYSNYNSACKQSNCNNNKKKKLLVFITLLPWTFTLWTFLHLSIKLYTNNNCNINLMCCWYSTVYDLKNEIPTTTEPPKYAVWWRYDCCWYLGFLIINSGIPTTHQNWYYSCCWYTLQLFVNGYYGEFDLQKQKYK